MRAQSLAVQNRTLQSLTAALVVASSLFLSTSAQAWDPFLTANSNVETGNARMTAGDAAGALAAYDLAAREHPSEPRVALNRGLALFASGDMPAAREAFVQAADPDAPVEIRAAAYYDLGLAFYSEGDAAATEEDHEAAQGHFREAADAFRRSLRVRPSDRDTAWNLELTLRRIREEEEAQQEQEEQEQQEQEEQEQQEGDEEGDQESEGDQEGDQENEGDQQNEGDEQNEGDQQEGDEQNGENEGENEGEGDEQNGENEGEGDEQNQDPNDGQGDEQDQNGQEAGDSDENNGGDDTPDSRPDQGEQMEGGQRPSHVDRVLDALQDNEQSLERARAHARASREGRRVLRDW